MTVRLKFEGWFQCRLATDPDPFDEPRGVSGYMRAVPGEPDFDRVLRFQRPGCTPRSHGPAIGVSVVKVFGSADRAWADALLGASVDLLDEPKFEGRNHAVAEDGLEPIVPLHVRVATGDVLLQRRHADGFHFPARTADDADAVQEAAATGLNFAPGAIAEATGIESLGDRWRERAALLRQDRSATQDEVEQAAIDARLRGLDDPSLGRFFGARMFYFVGLRGEGRVTDPAGRLPVVPLLTDPQDPGRPLPWTLEMWLGAWDPDAMCGFVQGMLCFEAADRDRDTPQGDATVARAIAARHDVLRR